MDPSERKSMENWIGVGIWIVMGGLIGILMKSLVKRPQSTSGHTGLIIILGAFAGVVGGMLGIGFFSFYEPKAISLGGMVGAAALAILFTFIYRWGLKSLI
jgi:hypothetical protein